MTLHISEILSYLNNRNYSYSYFGSKDITIHDYCSIKNLKEDAITWIKNLESYDLRVIDKNKGVLVITNKVVDENKIIGYNLISCDNPKEVFFDILYHFFKASSQNIIEKSSTIKTMNIGVNISIGHNCYISEDVIIGDNVVIRNNVVIECKTTIGDNTIIHSGVIIGADGFGYYEDKNNNIHKVPHFGGVFIGKNVEIGANTCIDRGTLDDTIIEDNVKIDNLCHIAHNVHIMENSYIIAMSMLGGSCIIQKGVYVAPGVLVMNQVNIGEGSILGMGSVVTKNVESNKVVVGVPAKAIRDNK